MSVLKESRSGSSYFWKSLTTRPNGIENIKGMLVLELREKTEDKKVKRRISVEARLDLQSVIMSGTEGRMTQYHH